MPVCGVIGPLLRSDHAAAVSQLCHVLPEPGYMPRASGLGERDVHGGDARASTSPRVVRTRQLKDHDQQQPAYQQIINRFISPHAGISTNHKRASLNFNNTGGARCTCDVAQRQGRGGDLSSMSSCFVTYRSEPLEYPFSACTNHR